MSASKKTRIDWLKVFGSISFALWFGVMLGLAVFFTLEYADHSYVQQEPQVVYPIYEDDAVLCYRITKGIDIDGVLHAEVQTCLKK